MPRPSPAPWILAAAFCAAACAKDAPPPEPETIDPTNMRIRVSEAGVSIGAEQVAPPLADKDQLIRPLVDSLRKQRDAWKAIHTTQTFVGHAEIEIAPSVSCRAAQSVISSAFVSEYTTFTLKSGAVKLDVPAVVRRPPPKEIPKEVPMDEPRRVVLWFHPDGSVDFKLSACLAPWDTLPGAVFAAFTKGWCGEAGGCVRETHLACDEKTPFEKVLPALAALRQVMPRMELAGSEPCDDPGGASPEKAGDPAAPAGTARAAGAKPRRVPYDVRVLPVTGVDAPRVDELTAPIRARLDDLKACYELGLAKNINLQGQVVTRIDINKKGAIMRTQQDAATDMPDKLVQSCVELMLRDAKFPASGSVVVLKAPILFIPPP